MTGGRICLTVRPEDNVTTLLDEQTGCDRLATGLSIAPGVPFGHKVALRDIACGAEVVKYGVVIGTAQADIAAGEHVHVHNLA
jgi:altronate dehydratase